MTDPVPPPGGYVIRCPCADLTPLTAEQAIKELGPTEQCRRCGVVWKLHWGRNPGGVTQPYWDADEPPPADWTPPAVEPPIEEPPGDQ